MSGEAFDHGAEAASAFVAWKSARASSRAAEREVARLSEELGAARAQLREVVAAETAARLAYLSAIGRALKAMSAEFPSAGPGREP